MTVPGCSFETVHLTRLARRGARDPPYSARHLTGLARMRSVFHPVTPRTSGLFALFPANRAQVCTLMQRPYRAEAFSGGVSLIDEPAAVNHFRGVCGRACVPGEATFGGLAGGSGCGRRRDYPPGSSATFAPGPVGFRSGETTRSSRARAQEAPQ